ncbi:hypothetical protein [Catelliglobosispora koreensis]|uniref:hypothetical protein n=1 Tax=Catelliglobosispora koreensis TaxID=129052 RepID=UPI00036E20F3|nr:hypothetical protein [Catelliglobosispora koreensis]
MLVRLALAWTDPFGVPHGAGELVDIDAVTLAELEEQGVVMNMTDPTPTWTSPTSDPEADPTWTSPTSDPDNEKDDWTSPTSEPDDDGNA